MSSVYDKFNDSPNQIRIEGQEISIRFQRTSYTTARISWNIPAPANGCSSDNQAYDGIVITFDNKPANYISTSPKDGTYYNGDPTADTNLHAGDKIDTAYVLAALYHDKTTTFIDIDGIAPRTPYYVSGYAVDNVGRYHREGVHAYSLPTGTQEGSRTDNPSKHEIGISSVSGIMGTTLTGLESNRNYTFNLKIDCKTYPVQIKGVESLTYQDLVNAINRALAEMPESFKSPNPPNFGEYYLDLLNKFLYKWDGFKNVQLDLNSSVLDPAQPIVGTFWFNTSNQTLYVYESAGWIAYTNIVESDVDPTNPECEQLWFNGTDAWEWESNRWCKLCVYNQIRNPLLPPVFNCDTYWYDSTNLLLYKWDNTLKKWNDILAIYTTKDPNTLNTGDYWYDETEEKMKQFVGGTWNELSDIYYVERDETEEFPDPPGAIAQRYWYIPSTGEFYRRNLLNTEWDAISFVSFPTDPRDIESCDLWWNSNPSIDYLYAWDEVNSVWKAVDRFVQSAIDPSLAPILPDCAVWYNPTTKKLKRILDSKCADMGYINSLVDPTNLDAGFVWKNGDVYKYWDGDEWIDLDIFIQADDPFVVDEGEFWLNLATNQLFQRVSGAWVEIFYSSVPLVPKVGDLWFNTLNKTLNEWNGTTWVETNPFAYVVLELRDCLDDKDKIVFYTKKTGCAHPIEVVIEAESVFSYLTNSVIYYDPINGTTGLAPGPMYKQLGVGDDGSPDERRALHDSIRITLGHPSVRVELTKEQLDECIDNALLMLRKNSNLSYRGALFFLDLKPNQQIYSLTDACVGFNKIVDVISIHRLRAGVFRNAFANNDAFQFAALQQLYRLGTFDMLTFHLTSSYIEELERIFAAKILYQWIENTRELKMYQVFRAKERVLVEATIEKTEQELFTDRETRHWIKRWAVADAKMMLSQVRGKFQTLPGPSGSTTLNSQELITQSEAEKADLKLELDDLNMQDAVDIGMKAHFVLG